MMYCKDCPVFKVQKSCPWFKDVHSLAKMCHEMSAVLTARELENVTRQMIDASVLL